jgi:hypothetical protein
MIESLLNKGLFILFFISIFNILRHGWKIIMRLRDSDVPNKYELTKSELIFLGISVAYLISTIFTGIRI